MIINDRTREIIREKFERELQRKVSVEVFTRSIVTSSGNVEYDRFSESLIGELSQINDKIEGKSLSLKDEEAKKLNLTSSPVILIGRNLGYSIEYWLPPAMHQAGTLIETISLASRGESGLTNASKEKLANIDKNVLLETYVAVDSPQCIQSALLSNRIAIEVPGKIASRLIDAAGSPKAGRFSISSVPVHIINEDINSSMRGFQSEQKLVNQIIFYGSSKAEEILTQEVEKSGKERELVDNPGYPVILGEDTFDKAVSKYPFLVVDCWAEWCGPCQMVHPIIENLARKYKGKIVFGKLNVDENRGVASMFGIMSIPTLLIFKNGKNVDSIIGAMPENVLDKKINAYRDS